MRRPCPTEGCCAKRVLLRMMYRTNTGVTIGIITSYPFCVLNCMLPACGPNFTECVYNTWKVKQACCSITLILSRPVVASVLTATLWCVLVWLFYCDNLLLWWRQIYIQRFTVLFLHVIKWSVILQNNIIFRLNGIMSYPCICRTVCHIHGTMWRATLEYAKANWR